MAEEIPQLKNIEPILNPVSIVSGAKEKQDIANQFMRAGLTAADVEQRVMDLQHNAATYQALTTARKLATDAELEILKSPSNASQIAQGYVETLRQIAKTTPSKDPNVLEYNIGNIANNLTYQASKTQIQDNLKRLRVDFDTNLKSSLAGITQSLQQRDIEGFKTKRENLIQTLHGLYSSGAMTRTEYLKYTDTLKHYDGGLAKLSNLKHGDEDSHIALANPLLDMGVPHQLGRKESANALADSLHTTNILSQLTSRIASGQDIEPATFIGLKEDKQNLVIDYAKGAAIVNGKLNAGTDFQELNLRHDYLKTLKNPTPVQQGELQRMDNVLNKLNAGEFNAVIAQIPDGKRIQAELQANSVPPPGATQEQADMTAYRARDEYLTKAATLWRSQNGDPSFIRVSANVASHIESALSNPEVSPIVALKELSSFSEPNRVYVANSLKDPTHQTAAFMMGTLLGKVPDSSLVDLITSIKNYKNNREIYSSITPSERKDISSSVAGFLGANQDELDYLQLVGAQDIRNSLAKLQSQYVLQKTLDNHGQIDGVDQFNDLIKKSLNVTSGPGYIFSLNAMPGVTPAQAQKIANKTLTEAYARIGIKYLKQTSASTPLAEGGVLSALGDVASLTATAASRLSNYFTRKNVPIRVFNELNGDIKAVDRNGQVIIQRHLTDDYIRSIID